MSGVPVTVVYSPSHRQHDPPGSSETPARMDRLLEAVDDIGLSAEPPGDFGMAPIEAVHSPELIAFLQNAYARFASLKEGPRPARPDSFAVRDLAGPLPRSIWGQLGYYCSDDLTPILGQTWAAAYTSAQVSLSAAAALENGGRIAYALCRPPGHHAYRDMYGGYCYLNNAAVAAHRLTERGRRVAVLDLDYHHGNGTQAIFYDRADVLFCSLHADPDDEYPYYCGFASETGAGEGEGYNINIPLPLGTGEADYLRALEAGLQAIDRFAPDTLLVSLGFDTLADDPEGGFRLQSTTFAHIGRMLASVGRPLLIVQEGGYRLDTLRPACRAFLEGLLP